MAGLPRTVPSTTACWDSTGRIDAVSCSASREVRAPEREEVRGGGGVLEPVGDVERRRSSSAAAVSWGDSAASSLALGCVRGRRAGRGAEGGGVLGVVAGEGRRRLEDGRRGHLAARRGGLVGLDGGQLDRLRRTRRARRRPPGRRPVQKSWLSGTIAAPRATAAPPSPTPAGELLPGRPHQAGTFALVELGDVARPSRPCRRGACSSTARTSARTSCSLISIGGLRSRLALGGSGLHDDRARHRVVDAAQVGVGAGRRERAAEYEAALAETLGTARWPSLTTRDGGGRRDRRSRPQP